MNRVRIIVILDRSVFRIQWVFDDDDFSVGAVLGEAEEDGKGAAPEDDRDNYEAWCANKIALESSPARDSDGFYWETRTAAKAVLRQIQEHLKQDSPLPEWAKQALAEGWKPPKFWRLNR